MPSILLDCELAERQNTTALHQGQVAYQIDRVSISTQELIALSVRAHLALQRIAHAAKPTPATEAVTVMTPELIASGVTQGRVALPRPPEPASAPDAAAAEQAEINRALAAFVAGEFQLVVDGVLYRTHEELQLNEHSRAVFLRLRPLVGG